MPKVKLLVRARPMPLSVVAVGWGRSRSANWKITLLTLGGDERAGRIAPDKNGARKRVNETASPGIEWGFQIFAEIIFVGLADFP